MNSDDRSSDRLVDMCAGAGIAFIPWYPLAAGRLVSPDPTSTVLRKTVAEIRGIAAGAIGCIMLWC
jgi:aryl-alcohol dehydrogenase-like predicted oxidoreductase